jgi:hypothetical protein
MKTKIKFEVEVEGDSALLSLDKLAGLGWRSVYRERMIVPLNTTLLDTIY